MGTTRRKAAIFIRLKPYTRQGDEEVFCSPCMHAIGKSSHQCLDLKPNDHHIFRRNENTSLPKYARFVVSNGESAHPKSPWNKGKTVGQRRPFTPREIQVIRYALVQENNTRSRDTELVC